MLHLCIALALVLHNITITRAMRHHALGANNRQEDGEQCGTIFRGCL